jgi:hypothetical protein
LVNSKDKIDQQLMSFLKKDMMIDIPGKDFEATVLKRLNYQRKSWRK